VILRRPKKPAQGKARAGVTPSTALTPTKQAARDEERDQKASRAKRGETAPDSNAAKGAQSRRRRGVHVRASHLQRTDSEIR